MNGQQERRITCPARRLEADGRVLTCTEDDPAKPMTHCNPEWHDSGMVVWHESDPCAWNAEAEGENVPLRLVGVGSLLDDGMGAALLAREPHPDTGKVVVFDPGACVAFVWSHDQFRSSTVVRAVPPSAADQPTSGGAA